MLQTPLGRLPLALCFSVAFGTVVSCGGAAGPPVIPDTPAGQAFRVWLDAYNAADSARLDAYAQRYEPAMSGHTQMVFRDQTGPWDVVSIERSEPRHLEVMLRTSSGPARKYSDAITMYGVIDLADTAATRAQTTFTLVGTGAKPPLRKIDATQRSLAIDSAVAKIVRNYVFPDVGKRLADSLLARRARGAYDGYANEISFAHRLNGDLLELGRDKQLGVEYVWQVPMPPPVPTPPAMLRCGFDPPTVLADSVGYVKFYGFSEPERDCGHEVSAAMNRVAGARALIIDMRENGGGSRSMMSYLATYLVPGCTHLDDIWDRRTGGWEAIWTSDGLPGPWFSGMKPLYILTSAGTFGTAEELAYDLQSLERAVVVGETTGGGAHASVFGQIGDHLLVRVPIARVVNPSTGTNWQGVGVVPNVRVPAREALATAQRLIHERRVLRASTPGAKFPSRLNVTQKDPEPAGRALAPRTDGADGFPKTLRGVRFNIDTIETHGNRRGPLTRVVGVAEFANGRGRLDVTAVRPVPALALNGVTIAAPLARPGDYYLFDNTGFVLVRPATRTFSSFVFTRAEFNHTGALLPGAFLFHDAPLHIDTMHTGDSERLREHAPVSMHWHMQPKGFSSPDQLYARGWLELADAPAVEAGVARWFEVAAALATMPNGVSALARGGVEVTSISLLRPPGALASATVYLEMLAPLDVAAVDVDPARLVLPSGYRETRWPGFERAPALQSHVQAWSVKWQTLEDSSTQRRNATCRAPWLPEPRGRSQF